MNSRRIALRVAAVICVLALTLAAAGCGSSYGDPEPGSSSYQGSLAG